MAETVPQQVKAPPRLGMQAPDFILPDSERRPVSLQDFRGKTVILVFYPAAFSGNCSNQMQRFTTIYPELQRAGAEVLGISVDLPYTLHEFKEKHDIPFPLLSDFDRKVIERYGVVNHSFAGFSSGVAQRAVFVVDPAGAIAWEWVADQPSRLPDYDRIIEAAKRAG